MFDVLASPLVNTMGHNACPTVSVTPETVEAAYTKETDLFAEHGIQYVHPLSIQRSTVASPVESSEKPSTRFPAAGLVRLDSDPIPVE